MFLHPARLRGTVTPMPNDSDVILFYRLAVCLEELAIQNEALWMLVRRFAPNQHWPAPELLEAKKKFAGLGIRAAINDPAKLAKLPALLEALVTQIEERDRAPGTGPLRR
jgi:hypothetical protein